MADYVTVGQLRTLYLPQVTGGGDADASLAHFISEATEDVNLALGFAFNGYDSEASERAFNSPGGRLLRLPWYEPGSLTALELADVITYTVSTDYEIETGPEVDAHCWLYRSGGWAAGRYKATAKWGYGYAPAAVVAVTCELAVNGWRGRDRGLFSDVVGVDGGGAVGYNRAMTNRQRFVLEQVRFQYIGGGFA
jgi:hypothetical protein